MRYANTCVVYQYVYGIMDPNYWITTSHLMIWRSEIRDLGIWTLRISGSGDLRPWIPESGPSIDRPQGSIDRLQCFGPLKWPILAHFRTPKRVQIPFYDAKRGTLPGSRRPPKGLFPYIYLR